MERWGTTPPSDIKQYYKHILKKKKNSTRRQKYTIPPTRLRKLHEFNLTVYQNIKCKNFKYTGDLGKTEFCPQLFICFNFFFLKKCNTVKPASKPHPSCWSKKISLDCLNNYTPGALFQGSQGFFLKKKNCSSPALDHFLFAAEQTRLPLIQLPQLTTL